MLSRTIAAVTGKVMAAPDQLIPMSADLEANQEKLEESEIKRGEPIQKQMTEVFTSFI